MYSGKHIDITNGDIRIRSMRTSSQKLTSAASGVSENGD